MIMTNPYFYFPAFFPIPLIWPVSNFMSFFLFDNLLIQ